MRLTKGTKKETDSTGKVMHIEERLMICNEKDANWLSNGDNGRGVEYMLHRSGFYI